MHEKIFFQLLLIISLVFNISFLKAQNNQDLKELYKSKIEEKSSMSIDSAVYYFNKLYDISSTKEQISLLRKEALFFSDNKMLTIAEKIFLKALDMSKRNHFKFLEARLNHTLGVFYSDRLNRNKEAYKLFLKAKDLYIETGNQKWLVMLNTNIANCLAESGDFEKSELLYNKCLSHYIEKKDSSGIVFVNINIANLLAKKGELTKSDSIFKMLLDSFPLKPIEKSFVLYNYTHNAIDQKKDNVALTRLNEAIKLTKPLQEEEYLRDLYFIKANIKSRKKRYKEAIFLYEKAVKTSKEIKDYDYLERLYFKQIGVFIKSKNTNKINELIKKVELIHDSISISKEEISYKEIFLENELNKKEKTIDYNKVLLINEKKHNKLLFILIILSTILLLTFALLFIQSKKNFIKKTLLIKQENQIEKIKIEKRKAIEDLKMENLKKEIENKRKKLLIDLAYKDKRKADVDTLLKRMKCLKDKSIISKDDIQKLIDVSERKFLQTIKEEKISGDVAQISKDFFDRLLKDFPSFSNNELKVLSYIRLNLGTKEIASIQNVSVDAIRKTRYRIRKKIGLHPKKSLEKFILKYR